MGWNEGYTVMEAAVVAAYDAGRLTPDVRKEMLAPYVGTDIDHGGCMDLQTADGKCADDVILFLLNPVKFERLCRVKRALGQAGNSGATIFGIGDLKKGAEVYIQYGGVEVRKKKGGGYLSTKTPEWEFGMRWLMDYEDAYGEALREVTGWC